MDYVVSVPCHLLSLLFLLPSRKEPDSVLGHPCGATWPRALFVVDVPQVRPGAGGDGGGGRFTSCPGV